MAEQAIALRSPAHRVERRAVWLWALQSASAFAVLLGALGLAYWLIEPARPWLGPALIVVGVWAAVQIPVMPLWRYAVHRWEVTDDAVYVATGWIVREWRVAPISRIQTVDTVQGPYQQLLGLATLTITTASSRGAVTAPGLDAKVAAQVAADLTRITQQTPGDAT